MFQLHYDEISYSDSIEPLFVHNLNFACLRHWSLKCILHYGDYADKDDRCARGSVIRGGLDSHIPEIDANTPRNNGNVRNVTRSYCSSITSNSRARSDLVQRLHRYSR